MGNVADSAWALWGILSEQRVLSLTEVMSRLHQPRANACQVLLWLIARSMVAWFVERDELYVAARDPNLCMVGDPG